MRKLFVFVTLARPFRSLAGRRSAVDQLLDQTTEADFQTGTLENVRRHQPRRPQSSLARQDAARAEPRIGMVTRWPKRLWHDHAGTGPHGVCWPSRTRNHTLARSR